MPVSWMQPSAIMTPGGVTAGLSDLAQVIASAPERQAAIQRQREADAREAARLAMAQTAQDRDYEQQQLNAERIRQEMEVRAAQDQRNAEIADMELLGLTEKTGAIPKGRSPDLRFASAATRGAKTRAAAEAAQADKRKAEQIGQGMEMVQGVRRGDLPTSALPLPFAAQGMAAYLQGGADRARANRESDAKIKALETRADREYETPEQRAARELANRKAASESALQLMEERERLKAIREAEDALAKAEERFQLAGGAGPRPVDDWTWGDQGVGAYDAAKKFRDDARARLEALRRPAPTSQPAAAPEAPMPASEVARAKAALADPNISPAKKQAIMDLLQRKGVQ